MFSFFERVSSAATLAAIATSKTPVIASHSNVRAISNATRNLSDEEIDRIGATGGVIHVAPFTAYLINFSTPEKLEAIKVARSAAGLPATYSYPYELYWELSDPVAKETFASSIREALGPATIDIMIDHIDYIVKRIGIDHVGIGTDFNHGSGIEGYEDASDSLAVTIGLLRRGYSADDIKKLKTTLESRYSAQKELDQKFIDLYLQKHVLESMKPKDPTTGVRPVGSGEGGQAVLSNGVVLDISKRKKADFLKAIES